MKKVEKHSAEASQQMLGAVMELMNHNMAYGFIVAMEGLVENPSMNSIGAMVFRQLVTKCGLPLAEAISFFRWMEEKGRFSWTDVHDPYTDEHCSEMTWEVVGDAADDFFREVRGNPCDRSLDILRERNVAGTPGSVDWITFLSERDADPLHLCIPAHWGPGKVIHELGSIYGYSLLGESKFMDERGRPPNDDEVLEMFRTAIGDEPVGLWGYAPCPTRANRVHLSILGITCDA